MSTSRCKIYIYLSIDRVYRTQCYDLYPYRLNPFTLHPCHNPFWLPPCTLLTTYDHLTCHSHHQCPQQSIVTIHCLNRTYSTYCQIISVCSHHFMLHRFLFVVHSVYTIFRCSLFSGYSLCSFWIRCMFILSHSHSIHFVCLPCNPWSPQVLRCFLLTPLLHPVAVIGGDLWCNTLLKSFFPGTSIHSLS